MGYIRRQTETIAKNGVVNIKDGRTFRLTLITVEYIIEPICTGQAGCTGGDA